MVFYDFLASFSKELVAHIDPQIFDNFQRFITTNSYLSLFIWTAITCASCNHILTKLSTQKGTALGSFLFLFTMVSILAGSTLFSLLTGQPIPWLKNNQIPHALVAIALQVGGGHWLWNHVPLIRALERSLVSIGTVNALIRTFDSTFSSYESITIAIFFSAIISSSRTGTLQIVDYIFFPDKFQRPFRPTKFCLLLACFYRVLLACSVPSSVIHVVCLILGQLFAHTSIITMLIDQLEDLIDSFFLIGNQDTIIYQFASAASTIKAVDQPNKGKKEKVKVN